jgi:polar amino acid transport system substrate-binding protein
VPGIDEQTRKKLAPTGRLRVGIAVGDAASAVWARRDAQTGIPAGPTVDLAGIFAQQAGVAPALVEYGSSGEIIEAAASGNWDISFTPVDAQRMTAVDFGPNFALGESTYMVPSGSTIGDVAEVDRPGTRIFGVENTATIRAARHSLKNTTAIGLVSLKDVLDKFRAGEADAIALGRESLLSLLPDFPGARVLAGKFLSSGTALAVPKGNSVALTVFTAILEDLKADGTIRAIFDKHGLTNSMVAPIGSRFQADVPQKGAG